MNCPKCGKELSQYAQRCDGCGQRGLDKIMPTSDNSLSGMSKSKSVLDAKCQFLCEEIKKHAKGSEDVILDFACEVMDASNLMKIIDDWCESMKNNNDFSFSDGVIFGLKKFREILVLTKELMEKFD